MLPQRYLPLTTFTRVFEVGRHTRLCHVTLHQMSAHKRQAFRFQHRPDQGRIAFTLVLKGMAQFKTRRADPYDLKPGALIKMHKDESFITDAKQEWLECSIVLDARTLQLLHGLGLLRHSLVVEYIEDLQPLLAAYLALARCIEAAAEDATVTQAIVDWASILTTLLNTTEPEKDGVERACDWLESTLHLRPGLAQAAAHANMSEATLRRTFRQRHGTSIGQWLLQRRIEKAQSLLYNHDIEEVSEALGYPDRFAFSKQFKQFVGQAPGQWKKSLIG